MPHRDANVIKHAVSYSMRLLALLCVLFSFQLPAQPLPELIPYSVGDKWGYSDSTGKIVIEPRWDAAFLFSNGKGRVEYRHDTGSVVCLIDVKGNYIVSPSLHWTGVWQGWDNATLNAHDSAGRYGMIDSNGKVLLPMVYDQPKSYWVGFKYSTRWQRFVSAVMRGGKEGVVDTAGNVLIPFAYDQVGFPADPDFDFVYVYEKQGTGILNLDGSELIAPRYYRINTVQYRNKVYFQPEVYTADSSSFMQGLYRKEPPEQIFPPVYNDITFVTDTSFILKQGTDFKLVNVQGKNLLPLKQKVAISLIGIAGDSIPDTLRVQANAKYRLLHAASLEPIGGWQMIQVGELNISQGTRDDRSSRVPINSDGERIPSLWLNGQLTYHVDKDSIRWALQRYVQFEPRCLLATGFIKGEKYFVILDEKGSYVSRPGRGDYNVYHWLPYEGLMIYRSHDGASVLADTGTLNPLVVSPKYDMKDGFVWKGQPYAVVRTHTNKQETRKPGGIVVNRTYEGEKNKLLQADITYVEALLPYSIGFKSDRAGNPVRSFEGLLRVTDSLGRHGIVDVDGNIIHKAVSFRYRNLRAFSDNIYLGHVETENPSRGILVDSNGVEYFPGLNAEIVFRAGVPSHRQGVAGFKTSGYGLYVVTYRAANGESNYFYMNTRGKAYASNF